MQAAGQLRRIGKMARGSGLQAKMQLREINEIGLQLPRAAALADVCLVQISMLHAIEEYVPSGA